jgi:hypothetical protein
MAGICEHGNEPSCSIKYLEILEKLNDYSLQFISDYYCSIKKRVGGFASEEYLDFF